MMMDYREKLRKQIKEAGANVCYTYVAHWIIVNSANSLYRKLKSCQIVFSSASATGVIAFFIANISWLGWLGSFASAITLGLNLYMLNFNAAEKIKKHTDAANDLWKIRESYKSLLVDFDYLSVGEIRENRDRLTDEVSRVNKAYPGTDENSFKKAQQAIGRYIFDDGEVENII